MTRDWRLVSFRNPALLALLFVLPSLLDQVCIHVVLVLCKASNSANNALFQPLFDLRILGPPSRVLILAALLVPRLARQGIAHYHLVYWRVAQARRRTRSEPKPKIRELLLCLFLDWS